MRLGPPRDVESLAGSQLDIHVSADLISCPGTSSRRTVVVTIPGYPRSANRARL